jgi:stage II sporulation protein P
MRLRIFLALILLLTSSALAEKERQDGFFSIVDDAGRILHQTAHMLSLGDEYIDEDNRLWRLERISGDKVQAKLVEKVKLPLAVFPSKLHGFTWGGKKGGAIAIYHTHSDESYVPTSGTSSKQWGDVYKVGEALTSALKNEGFKVYWSKNNHNPHDGMAYKRSRTTAFELLKSQPAALIDIHRDAVPPEAYKTQVGGKPATKVMIVVGKQNQNRGSNLEFAKAVKANADARHPGIVKGILFANGNYNQDLGPRTILLEFGTDQNSLEAAKRSAHEWAHIISAAVYGQTGGAGPGQATRQRARQGGRSISSIIWLLGIALGGGLLYLWLSSGSWSKALDRVKNMGTEFSSSFFSRREPPDDEEK